MDASANRNRDIYLLVVLVLIFHAGWIKFNVRDYIFLIDYIQRIIIIAVFLAAVRPTNWRYRPPISHVILIIAATFVDRVIFFAVEIGFQILEIYRFGSWTGFPPIENPAHRIFDWSIGLVLVAVSEEFIYRKLMNDVMDRHNFRPANIYLISSIAFALLHINQGLDQFLTTFVAGGIFMYVYRWSGTIYVPIAVHYFINLWIFSDAHLSRELARSLGII
jgi:membrane protease YdiL (CAAX protease family)